MAINEFAEMTQRDFCDKFFGRGSGAAFNPSSDQLARGARDMKSTEKFVRLVNGHVHVRKILRDKPQMSDDSHYGYIWNGAGFNPDCREECDAVGELRDTMYKDGVVVVGFHETDEGGTFHWCTAFAHIEDIESANGNEQSIPTNKGLVFSHGGPGE